MFDRLEIFMLASAQARHAAARQAVVAQNIANADTPGYRTKDITEFAEVLRSLQRRPERLNGMLPIRASEVSSPASPNGNNVSLELEMLRGVEADRAHSRALRVYGSAMEILRTSLGRR